MIALGMGLCGTQCGESGQVMRTHRSSCTVPLKAAMAKSETVRHMEELFFASEERVLMAQKVLLPRE